VRTTNVGSCCGCIVLAVGHFSIPPGYDAQAVIESFEEREERNPDMANETVADVWGLQCPSCWRDSQIHIDIIVSVTLTPDGTDYEGGDHEWDDKSFCRCDACGNSGTVADFKIDEVAE
jgi:hypothetical protein